MSAKLGRVIAPAELCKAEDPHRLPASVLVNDGSGIARAIDAPNNFEVYSLRAGDLIWFEPVGWTGRFVSTLAGRADR